MPLSPTGQYTLPNGYLAVTGQDILPSNHNPPLEDIANVLSEAFYRTGVAPMLAALNFNTFKGINLANGTNNADAVNKAQLDAAVSVIASNAIKFALSSGNIMVQWDSVVIITNGAGVGSVTFPTPFTSGVPLIVATAGDGSSYVILSPPPAGVNFTGFNFNTSPAVISSPFRINYIAIGTKT